MKNPSKKKGLNGRRTKTSKRQAPKRTEKTETASSKNRKEQSDSMTIQVFCEDSQICQIPLDKAEILNFSGCQMGSTIFMKIFDDKHL